jgi:biopolymer transport protein ExbD
VGQPIVAFVATGIESLPQNVSGHDSAKWFPSFSPSANCSRNATANFGLLYEAVLWILIFLFLIFPGRRDYSGLSIDLRTQGMMIWEKSPWQETLSVYLGVGEKYCINGKPVAREGLRERLPEESRRAVWTVYFEADHDVQNMNAICAFDTIQGVGAELVWITPTVREELQQKETLAGHGVP